MSTINTWTGMKQRCGNSKNPQWKDYGGRGIRNEYKSFKEFLADMGECPPGLTIDRIDNDGHYKPGNLRWATRAEQQRNRRNPVFIEIEGKSYRVLDLKEKYGVKHDVLKARAKKGLSFAEVTSQEPLRDLSGLALGGQVSGAKRRQRTHCSKGHEFTPENTRITPDGWRNCRECHRLKMSRRFAARKTGG